MAKTDIDSAFRLIPIHPEDYNLSGFKSNGFSYYDIMLPKLLVDSFLDDAVWFLKIRASQFVCELQIETVPSHCGKFRLRKNCYSTTLCIKASGYNIVPITSVKDIHKDLQNIGV